MAMHTTRVVFVTVPNVEVGASLARELLEARRVACVNILPAIRSLYWWEGKIQDDGEALLIMKTEEALLEDLIEQVTQAHPYTVPEVIALPVVAGAEPYLDWVRASTGSGELTS